jgi:hypothetical protein
MRRARLVSAGEIMDEAPLIGVTFDQAAAGPPDTFGDLFGAIRAGPGDQQCVTVMPVPARARAMASRLRGRQSGTCWKAEVLQETLRMRILLR